MYSSDADNEILSVWRECRSGGDVPEVLRRLSGRADGCADSYRPELNTERTWRDGSGVCAGLPFGFQYQLRFSGVHLRLLALGLMGCIVTLM